MWLIGYVGFIDRKHLRVQSVDVKSMLSLIFLSLLSGAKETEAQNYTHQVVLPRIT